MPSFQKFTTDISTYIVNPLCDYFIFPLLDKVMTLSFSKETTSEAPLDCTKDNVTTVSHKIPDYDKSILLDAYGL